jgi:hypothetical protein
VRAPLKKELAGALSYEQITVESTGRSEDAPLNAPNGNAWSRAMGIEVREALQAMDAD